MDSKLIDKNILGMVKENKQLTIQTFIAFIRQEFESYNILLKYLQALHLFVLGTIVRIQLKPALDESGQPIPNKVIFHRLFWSFKTCIVVFAFCKPMVQIDET
ncbi:hypothetical protein GmHk_19G055737 [Glycine max]|nr:hypothetical protein GmHk_19G055737 [Glycine max]